MATFCRYLVAGRRHYGAVVGEEVHELTAAPWRGGRPNGKIYQTNAVRLLAPTVPSKAVCIGVNYRAHAQEMGHELPQDPVMFLKPPTALLDPEGFIIYPPDSHLVHHEGELAVVIGKRAKSVPVDEALNYVFGYTCANDVTARDLQQKDGQWTRGKGFDTFMPLGPVVVSGLDPTDLAITCRVNGEVRQSSRTSYLIHNVAELVSFASRVMTLLPGDVLLTGTPAGVGPLVPGDVVEVEIEGIGVLRNRVAAP